MKGGWWRESEGSAGWVTGWTSRRFAPFWPQETGGGICKKLGSQTKRPPAGCMQLTEPCFCIFEAKHHKQAFSLLFLLRNHDKKLRIFIGEHFGPSTQILWLNLSFVATLKKTPWKSMRPFLDLNFKTKFAPQRTLKNVLLIKLWDIH